MAQWTIHEMRAADVDAALVVWDEAGTPVADSAFSVAEVIHAISEGDPAVLAEADGRVVGTACSVVAGDRARICRLTISPAWCHQEIGSATRVALEQNLTATGVNRMSALLLDEEIGEEASAIRATPGRQPFASSTGASPPARAGPRSSTSWAGGWCPRRCGPPSGEEPPQRS